MGPLSLLLFKVLLTGLVYLHILSLESHLPSYPILLCPIPSSPLCSQDRVITKYLLPLIAFYGNGFH